MAHVMITDSRSYPHLSLARRRGLPYWVVLCLLDEGYWGEQARRALGAVASRDHDAIYSEVRAVAARAQQGQPS